MKKALRRLALFVLLVVVAISSVLMTACEGDKEPSEDPSTNISDNGDPSTDTPDNGDPSTNTPSDDNNGENLVAIPIEGETRYEFDAVKGYAKLTCGEGKGYDPVNNPDGPHVTSQVDAGAWITGFTWDSQAKLTINAYSDTECQADFVLRVRKTAEVVTLTDRISVSIDSDSLESEAQVPASSGGATAEFAEVNLGRFSFGEGNNVITIVPQTSVANFDFSAVILYSDADANLRWNELKNVTGTIFYGIEDYVEISDTYKKNLEENCLGPANVYDEEGTVVKSAYTSNSAKWPIYASRDAVANISVIMCSMTGQWSFTSIYQFLINNVQKYSSAQTPLGEAWGDYQVVELGEYELQAGLNEIEINKPEGYDTNYNLWFNIRAIIIDTDANVDWEEVDSEAHVCLHVCPVCGGCLNDDCLDEACATKCSCPETTTYTFVGYDGNAILGGEAKAFTKSTQLWVSYPSKGSTYTDLITVTFNIDSDIEQDVKLGFCIGGNPNYTWTFVDYFRVWVNVDTEKCNDTDGADLRLNKEDYTAQTVQGDAGDFYDIMLGTIHLNEGKNTIVLGWTWAGSSEYKIRVRSMLIDASSYVGWYTET